MENFIPKQPKIKYIIPKVIPTSFSLHGELKEDIDMEEDNKFNYDNDIDSDSELECDDLDLNNYNEKSLSEPNQNSIYFTLLNLKKRSESNSSIETKDSL